MEVYYFLQAAVRHLFARSVWLDEFTISLLALSLQKVTVNFIELLDILTCLNYIPHQSKSTCWMMRGQI